MKDINARYQKGYQKAFRFWLRVFYLSIALIITGALGDYNTTNVDRLKYYDSGDFGNPEKLPYRTEAATFVRNNTLYVWGGRSRDGNALFSFDAFSIDANNGQLNYDTVDYNKYATPWFHTAGSAAVLLPDNNRVLFFGGDRAPPEGGPFSVQTGEMHVVQFDFTSGNWTFPEIANSNGTIPRNIESPTATLAPNGKIYIAGGSYINSNATENSTESTFPQNMLVYDPEINYFSTIDIKENAQYALLGPATVLSDGRIVYYKRMGYRSHELGNLVAVFDTNTNQTSIFDVGGHTLQDDYTKEFSYSFLGSDQLTIYYYGGVYNYGNRVKAHNTLIALNTDDWALSYPAINSTDNYPRRRYSFAAGVLNNSYLLVAFDVRICTAREESIAYYRPQRRGLVALIQSDKITEEDFFQQTTGDASFPNDTRIQVELYPPGRNPNLAIAYYGEEFLAQELPQEELDQWLRRDVEDSQAPNKYTFAYNSYTSISYQLQNHQYLTSNGWNNVGFLQEHDNVLELTTSVRTLDGDLERGGTFDIYPMAMTEVTLQDQKVYTLLNALGSVGGLLSLLVTVDSLLFGARPKSPWGFVQRYSIFKARASLMQNLYDAFGFLGRPIPYIDPIHKRFEDAQTYQPNLERGQLINQPTDAGKKSEITMYTRSSEQQILEEMQELQRRLQLMESIFKAYYIDEEVFQNLSAAHGKIENGDSSEVKPSVVSGAFSKTRRRRTVKDALLPTRNSSSSDDDSKAENTLLVNT
ncbi:hypothetical protein BJV82DRAFT_659618 [Fennellomyces sp. T-0311]|nr:hypothetical protein BJV82DRAFT_659618 [Fennellomyces sp. T-0311]